MAKFAAKLHRLSTKAEVFGAVAAMSQTIGGPMGFAVAFKETLDASPLGSARAADLVLALMRLIEEFGPKPRDPSEYSDEALEQRMFVHVIDTIRKRPQIAVEVAAHLGWQVIPPTA